MKYINKSSLLLFLYNSYIFLGTILILIFLLTTFTDQIRELSLFLTSLLHSQEFVGIMILYSLLAISLTIAITPFYLIIIMQIIQEKKEKKNV